MLVCSAKFIVQVDLINDEWEKDSSSIIMNLLCEYRYWHVSLRL